MHKSFNNTFVRCNKVKLLLQTEHGHVNLKQFLQFTVHLTLLHTVYIFKHTFSHFFVVEYTLKLVHRTPNIQTNLNTVKLHYSNIKMECSVKVSARPRAAVNITAWRVEDWRNEGERGRRAALPKTLHNTSLSSPPSSSSALSFHLSISIVVLCAKEDVKHHSSSNVSHVKDRRIGLT